MLLILKKSLLELYEDLQDKKIIEKFEKNEKEGKVSFTKIDDLL